MHVLLATVVGAGVGSLATFVMMRGSNTIPQHTVAVRDATRSVYGVVRDTSTDPFERSEESKNTEEASDYQIKQMDMTNRTESVEFYSREDVLSGATTPTVKVSGNDAFNDFKLTHQWTGKADIVVKIWEAPGMWPGEYPAIAQVWKGEAEFLHAAQLTLPAARPIRFSAFSLMHSMIIINVACEHRHNEEIGVYAFRVDRNSKWMEGGAVVENPNRPLQDEVSQELKKQNNKGCSEWVSDNEPIRLRP